jgi:hypothetical protein
MKLSSVSVWVALVVGLHLQTTSAQSRPVILITDDEGKFVPAPPSDLNFRAGVSRGPSITVLSPTPGEGNLQSPFHLQLKFEGRGGAEIDPESLRLTYTKSPAVDLTARVKPFVKPDGLDVPEASVPPGNHTLRAQIKDKDGRPGSVTFTLKVSK